MKRVCCVINAIFAFSAFCIMFGYVCFVGGRDRATPTEMSGAIVLVLNYLAILIVAVALVHNSYYSVRPLIFASVFASALIILSWIVEAIFLFTGSRTGPTETGAYIVLTVISLIMSTIYLFAALKKEK